MSNVIPFKAKNLHHDTELEFSDDGHGNLCVVARQNGPGKMGIAFWMDREEETNLFNWMLARRIV